MPYLTHPDLPGQGFDVADDEAASAWARSGWVPGERPVPADDDDAVTGPVAPADTTVKPPVRPTPKEK